ncbi:MAG: hypothetical protein GF364_13070 [Candidatus Lokiarchaeota archaeon]|nr:hypothetical protein [Candidatus Lokiarchaeota archaeon]
MMLVFGYGTFITKKIYKDKNNVQPAYLPRYFRVYRPRDWFPYVIKSSDCNDSVDFKPGFWGLVFQVNKSELTELDLYEGEGSLYKRISEQFLLPDGSKIDAFLYYPMKNTIRRYNLMDYIRLGDLWRKKIIEEHPDIVKEFPQLALKKFHSKTERNK